jgi:hypothetical protein
MLLASVLDKLHLGLPDAHIEFVQMMISLAFFQVSSLVWITLFLRLPGLSGRRPTAFWWAHFFCRPHSRCNSSPES